MMAMIASWSDIDAAGDGSKKEIELVFIALVEALQKEISFDGFSDICALQITIF